MPGEDFLVDPGPAVEPLAKADGREPDQVPVPGGVPGQEDQVAVRRRGVGRLLLDATVAEGEIRLEAENRAELPGLRLFVKAPRRMEVAVVGDGEAVHAQALNLGHEVRDPVGPVEEGVFAVGVEMDEGHWGGLHAPALRRGQRATGGAENALYGGGGAALRARNRPLPRIVSPVRRVAAPRVSTAIDCEGLRGGGKLPAS